MANPKSLVFHLHKHWDLIESLTRLSRNLPAFDEQQVLVAIGRHHADSDLEDHRAVLRGLCNADVLQWLSRSNSLQINPLVLDFVRGLSREHELGLSSVLKARVEAIRSASGDVQAGLDDSDHDALRRGAAKLADLFRQISQQLEQDHHAILEIAEQAKASDTAMPLARRYRAVLEAYDQYVEPMNEMMDTGVDGTFYPYLEAAELVLDRATELLSVEGGLYSHRMQLRLVAYQAKELRRLGRVVAQHCADVLLPLREEARQHNELSAAISAVLGRVRKQGLRKALRQRKAGLPVWRPQRRVNVSVGDEVLAIMAEARAFEPRIEAFPEELPAMLDNLAVVFDEKALKASLKQALPVADLLAWLRQHYPALPDATLLRVYHDLVRNPAWAVQCGEDTTQTDLTEVRVYYHPHQLNTKEPAAL